MKMVYSKIILSLSLIIFLCACDLGRRDSYDTDNDTKYERGFFTDKEYINECLGMKYVASKGFKFKDTADITENNRAFSNIASVNFEAMCIADGVNVTFYSERVGMEKTMDQLLENYANNIKDDERVASKSENSDEIDLNEEKVEIAGKTFRKINFTFDKIYKKMDTTLFLRIVGSDIFVIEVACTKGCYDVDEKVKEVLSDIHKLDDNNGVKNLKNESERYKSVLLSEKEKAKKDPSVDMDFFGYRKGEITKNIYANRAVGLKFTLPEGAKFTKNHQTSELEAVSKDSTSKAYIWCENLGCVLSMDEYIDSLKFISENSEKKYPVVNTINDKEEFAGKTWTIFVRDLGKKNGHTYYLKQYTRILKTNAYCVCFKYSVDNEDSFNELKNSFELLKEEKKEFGIFNDKFGILFKNHN